MLHADLEHLAGHDTHLGEGLRRGAGEEREDPLPRHELRQILAETWSQVHPSTTREHPLHEPSNGGAITGVEAVFGRESSTHSSIPRRMAASSAPSAGGILRSGRTAPLIVMGEPTIRTGWPS